MSLKETIDLTAIAIGVAVMMVAAARAWGMRHAVQAAGYCNALRVLLGLMVLFMIGYLFSIWAIAIHQTVYLYSVVAFVYLFGSLFVLLTVSVAGRTAEQLRRYNAELEQLVAERTAELQVALKQEQSARQRFAQLFSEMPAACFTYDRDGVILDWNTECTRLYGFSAEQVIGKTIYELICHPEEVEATREAIQQVFSGKSLRNLEWQDRTLDGQTRWILCNTFPLHEMDGRVAFGISANIDITERKRQEQLIQEQRDELEAQNATLHLLTARLSEAHAKLEQMAATDALTGLPNHRVFRERLWREYLWSLEHDEPLSLVMLDVDHFKHFNDTYGHQAGDEVLRKVAMVLQQQCQSGFFVARYGGEEFAVILPQTDIPSAMAFAEQLREAIARIPCCYRPITASFGVSTLDLHTLNPDSLIEEADQSLYASKRNGRNRVTHAAECGLLVKDISEEEWLARVREALADPNGYAFHRVISQMIFDHIQLWRQARTALRHPNHPFTVPAGQCRFGVWAREAGEQVTGLQKAIESHDRFCALLYQAHANLSPELIEQAREQFTDALHEMLMQSQLAA